VIANIQVENLVEKKEAVIIPHTLMLLAAKKQNPRERPKQRRAEKITERLPRNLS